ncbi:ATP-binding protein [Dyadobacter sp. 3J3]|uniref:AAA family ATPase n=1 Tax=Dyadobacter sp. 3J3 TaxID=2606600 RepID=UPI00135CDE78|nr:ATP-binding protein [Dyadobacter sp. 3J3]
MIIIVSGLPGSGKSYFASRFAKQLGATYLSSDQLRLDKNALGKYSLKDKLSIYLAMSDQTAKAVNKGRHVVVDATFYHHTMRDLFMELANMHQTPLYVILVVADTYLIRERLSKPRELSEADLGVYTRMKEEFEKMDMPHLVLQSEKNNIEAMLQLASDYIYKIHE